MEKLLAYLEYPFVYNAIIVGTLISLCASLFGVVLVLKRFSYIGDGLSHVAFGATAIASALNLTNNMPFVLFFTIICAVCILKSGSSTKIKGDASIAMMSVGSLAVGYFIMNFFATSSNISGDVCTTLFGSTSILTLSKAEVLLSIILAIFVVIIFIIFYNKIFAITFDEDFSVATGTKTYMYNFLIATVIAIIIVLAMKLVGSLLITALVIFPAISAMRVFKNFKSVIICVTLFSTICAFSGTIFSILIGTPVGSTIVIVNIAGFALFSLIGKVLKI